MKKSNDDAIFETRDKIPIRPVGTSGDSVSDGKLLVTSNGVYAWGKVLSVTDKDGNAITDADNVANINPIRYRGYYYDKRPKQSPVAYRKVWLRLRRKLGLIEIDMNIG